MFGWLRQKKPQVPGADAPLSAAEIALVQESFAQVAPISAAAAAMFYDRLFKIAPEVRRLFNADLAEQGRKLMAMLATVVGALDDLPALVPAAEALARRHAGYGVAPAHYAKVGEALIGTLEQALADAFTPDVRAAWTKAYGLLSDVMIKAAYPAEAA